MTAHGDPSLSGLIEIGWLVLGPLDPVDREAVEQARRELLARLEESFPGFTWRMPVVERHDAIPELKVEPVRLLGQGETERDARHWDFALVVTGADLVSHYKPFALGAPSRSLGVAVLSTVRVDPQAHADGGGPEERRETMARRLVALTLHLFGHLNDLEHDDEPGSAMYDLQSPADLDAMGGYTPSCRGRLHEELREVADLRLEEAEPSPRPNRLRFYLRTARNNWDDIASAVRQARPWRFPVQLSKLSTAAGSALLVVILTAEAWELGMALSPLRVTLLGLLVLVVTTAFVLHRQRLLGRRGSPRLTEQTAVTRISITLSMVLGLATTYLLLFLVTLAAARLFFPARLATGWAASTEGALAWEHYLLLAGFVASLGLVIGALGASFEEEHYFRHIAYVDEET